MNILVNKCHSEWVHKCPWCKIWKSSKSHKLSTLIIIMTVEQDKFQLWIFKTEGHKYIGQIGHLVNKMSIVFGVGQRKRRGWTFF